MNSPDCFVAALRKALAPHDGLSPLARRVRLLALTQLLVFSVVQLAPAQGQFKYEIDRSRGANEINDSKFDKSSNPRSGKSDLWFGRTRERTVKPADRQLKQSDAGLRVLPDGGAVANIPWKHGRENPQPVKPGDLLELSPEQIVVEQSRIRIDKQGGYVIDVHARVASGAPSEFITVAGLTRNGEGFAPSGAVGVDDFLAWKKIERDGSSHILMSFSLPRHYSMRRYQNYLVKFYATEGFTESQLPRD